MLERMQWYQLDTGAVANTPATSILEFELQLDSDAPFILRAIGAFITGQVGIRFTSPDGRWIQRLVSTSISLSSGLVDNGAFYGQWAPVYPNLVYPAGATIQMQLVNLSGGPFGDFRLIFVGTRLFCEGQVWAPAPPKNYRAVRFDYNVSRTLQIVDLQRDVIFHVNSDADFLWCGGVDADNTTDGGNIEVRIRDGWGKYYMNDFIQTQQLFGRQVAQRPGLIFPGIFIPREQNMYLDLRRNAGGELGPVLHTFTMKGFKLYTP
jgi:hypothetical protein